MRNNVRSAGAKTSIETLPLVDGGDHMEMHTDGLYVSKISCVITLSLCIACLVGLAG